MAKKGSTNAKLRGYRCMRRMTQREFAKALNVSPATISNVETGKWKASKALIAKVGKTFPTANIVEDENGESSIAVSATSTVSTEPMSLGEVIRFKRKTEGLTQEELGRKINTSRSTIASWENEVTEPPIEKIKEICNEFDVSACELLGLVCFEADSGLYDLIKKYSELSKDGQTKARNYIYDIHEMVRYRR